MSTPFDAFIPATPATISSSVIIGIGREVEAPTPEGAGSFPFDFEDEEEGSDFGLASQIRVAWTIASLPTL
tara:strand:+ start:233 stop:445 length:213 start_codon:yes stop_codon:yes gene_type:complete